MSHDPDVDLFLALSPEQRAVALATVAQSRNGHGPGAAVNGSGPAGVYVPQPLNLKDLLRRDFPPLSWRIDGLVADGHLGVVAGRPKIGKSWMVLQMAQSVDTGRPFLGRDTRRGRVLYVALEDGERRIYQRCKILKWQPEQTAVLFDIATFDGEGGPGPGVEQVARLASDYDLIIIDTLIAALSGRANENDNTQMGAIVNELARIAHATETAVLLIHHTSKGSAENIFDLLRGASALRGAYDTGMLLQRKQDEREAVLHVESRDVDSFSLTIRQADGGAGWDVLGNGLKINEIRAGRRVVQALTENGDALTAEEVGELLKITRQAAHNQLVNAERDGYVKRRPEEKEGSKKPVDVWYLT